MSVALINRMPWEEQKTCIQVERYGYMKAEIRVMPLQAKERRRLPANHQKLRGGDERGSTHSSEPCWPLDVRLTASKTETIRFCCLSTVGWLPCVFFAKLISWYIPSNLYKMFCHIICLVVTSSQLLHETSPSKNMSKILICL